MKLSRKVWLIIVIVIFAVALGILFWIYSGQAEERSQLNDRMSRAQTLLPGLVDNREEKEDELATAQSSLNAYQAKFPRSVESIEYEDDLFEIAEDCNVDIATITASPPAGKTVGSITYYISSFVVRVSGSIDDILDFIYALRIGDEFQLPWSAEVNGVQLSVDGGAATINLAIYGYKR